MPGAGVPQMNVLPEPIEPSPVKVATTNMVVDYGFDPRACAEARIAGAHDVTRANPCR